MAALEYTIDKNALEASIELEVSKVAARTTDKNGQSAYDLYKIYKSDKTLVENAISDAVKNILAAFPDIATYQSGSAQANDKVLFDIPDFNSSNEDQANETIGRFIVAHSTAAWFESRLPEVAKSYAEQSIADMKIFSNLVRQRKPITRT